MTSPSDPAVQGGVHGWLVIDKPYGMSSARAVALVKRSSGVRKIGHAGTLDPLATGVLPLALGEATKTVQFATAGKKRYRFRIRWGEARDTDDREGDSAAIGQIASRREQEVRDRDDHNRKGAVRPSRGDPEKLDRSDHDECACAIDERRQIIGHA